MNKILFCVLAVIILAVSMAPSAKADDCGYWATRYETVYVPPVYLGNDLYGRPVYSSGYYVQRPITYYVYRPCVTVYSPSYSPRVYRHHHRRPRISIGFHW